MLNKIKQIIAATTIVLLTAIPAIANSDEPELIDCIKMQENAHKLLQKEAARLGIKLIKHPGAQKYSLAGAIGLQRANHYKTQYEKLVLIEGKKMRLDYIDNFDQGFTFEGENGYNQFYITAQLMQLSRRLKLNKTSPVHYGVSFVSNLNPNPYRRQCAGTVVYSSPK